MPTSSIFVFGSNLVGAHGGGAAAHAFHHYGAELGVGEGPTGQSYALPTMDEQISPRNLVDIRASVERFLRYAAENPGNVFRVTRVGCGIAGFTDAEIAPMFSGAPQNCEFDPAWASFGLKTWRSE
ncbi:A1S_2505 family phage non-structural protein [Silvibacterium acidisoli]|uniref:A1S_2505 family phage non-structural protein n=1 Tax=Acidobacteriaceae bacterium ZG23-2 TaxID=2883246 RepID=UPI00406D256E